ncbi:hypothetical protein HUT06_05790 [Actinomadura sp. NAK00032]|uniref:hypothetical protein n=1 Tax=Actinomadura sp. NAK00032 TaxID=2742128 RepID=UPI00159124AE|nr:hypothetical protein [Actinomadura sp. NAK00032]QKW33600.1 hypothetical protein HUT06_05790 [Actinomadura sp. NAK00032]
MHAPVELDVGMPPSSKYTAAVLTAILVVVEVFLVAVVWPQGAGGMFLAVCMAIVSILGLVSLSLSLVVAIGMFRYRVWLEGTTLCIQAPFRVRRSDLAQAATVEVQENARGVPFLIVRGGGGELLQARMLTSEKRSLPYDQLEALADAVAAGPAAEAPETRKALARLRPAR